ncbi:MAG: hypothetical protein PHI52_00475 [Bacteroidales bacterium]|nr:hypothetical protein [Bacteroidales bacterium]
MSTVLFYIIVAAKCTMYAFGLCFYVWVLFTPILKHLILLAKQAFVYKTLIFTPPPQQQNNARWVWEVMTFIEGVSLKAMFYLRTHLPLVSI